jgi:TonB family protein
VEENIRVPETLKAGEKAIVIVNFIVRNTGEIDSLKVIRSPGDEFSSEAKRLIIEGPQWRPAKSDGERIDDEVRIRIVFK